MFQDRLYTRTEYEALIQQHPERRLERINGEIVEKMPTQYHGVIVYLIAGFLFNYLREKPIGHVAVEARYGLPDDDANDHIPDLSFFTRERGPIVTSGATPYMPDLAVEVQSPGQSERFLVDKGRYYLAHGSRMVWLVYPERRTVTVLTPDKQGELSDTATLKGGDVLPGFSVPVQDLFPK